MAQMYKNIFFTGYRKEIKFELLTVEIILKNYMSRIICDKGLFYLWTVQKALAPQ